MNHDISFPFTVTHLKTTELLFHKQNLTHQYFQCNLEIKFQTTLLTYLERKNYMREDNQHQDTLVYLKILNNFVS